MKSKYYLFIGIAAIGLSLVGYQYFSRASAQGPVRDAMAVNIMTSAFQAMGGNTALSSISDAVITAQVSAEDNAMGSITVKAKGLNQLKLESKLGTEEFIQTLDRNRAWAKANGKVFDLSTDYVAVTRNNFLPLLGQFIRFLNPSTSVKFVKTATIAGMPNPVHIIEVDEMDADTKLNLSGVVGGGAFFVYIDSTTNLVNRIEYSIGALDTSASRGKIQFDYSDYRQTGLMLAPYRIMESFGEQPRSDFQVRSILTNQGLMDGEFTKPTN
jgi:hypothetical protein